MSTVRAQLGALGVQKVRRIRVRFMRHCSLRICRRGRPQVPQTALLSPDHRGLSVWLVLLWGCLKEGAEPPSGAGVQAVTSEPDQAASLWSGVGGAALPSALSPLSHCHSVSSVQLKLNGLVTRSR